MSARPFANLRTFRVKSPKFKFLCPLCGVQRGLRYPSRLEIIHYIQIFILTSLVTLVLFPWLEWKGIISLFFLWAAYESVIKILHRREIPCPDCGFDATWYKRDVKMARKLVSDFWSARNLQEDHPD